AMDQPLRPHSRAGRPVLCHAVPFAGKLHADDLALLSQQEAQIAAVAEAHLQHAVARAQVACGQFGRGARALAPNSALRLIPPVPKFTFIACHDQFVPDFMVALSLRACAARGPRRAGTAAECFTQTARSARSAPCPYL